MSEGISSLILAVNVDLWANAAVSVLSAVIYVYVGHLMWNRRLEGGSKLAAQLFGVWWYSLAFVSLSSSLLILAAIVGVADLALTVSVVYVLMIVISIALWGLLYYLVYVYTGSSKWLWPLSAFYGLVAFGLIYLITWMNPTSVSVGTFALDIDYERTLTGWPVTLVTLAFSGPALAAAIAYASLYFRATGSTEKFRIAVVSSAFILWFAWSLISGILELNTKYPDSLALLVAGKVIGLMGPMLVLMAYRPPGAIRRRFNVRGLDETEPRRTEG